MKMLVTILGVLTLLQLACSVTSTGETSTGTSITAACGAFNAEKRDKDGWTDWHDWTSPTTTATVAEDETTTTETVVVSPMIVVSSGISFTTLTTITESTNPKTSSENSGSFADNGSTGMPVLISTLDGSVTTSTTYFPMSSQTSTSSPTVSSEQSPQVIVIPGQTTFTTQTWVPVSTSSSSPTVTLELSPQVIVIPGQTTFTTQTWVPVSTSTADSTTSTVFSSASDCSESGQSSSKESESTKITASTESSTDSVSQGGIGAASSASATSSPTSSSSDIVSASSSSGSTTTESSNMSTQSTGIETTGATSIIPSSTTVSSSTAVSTSSSSPGASSPTEDTSVTSTSSSAAVATEISSSSTLLSISTSESSASSPGIQTVQSTSSSENSSDSSTSSSTTPASTQSSSSAQTSQSVSIPGAQSSCPYTTDTVEPISTSYTYLSSGTTYTTVFVATVDLCGEINDLPSVTPSPEPTVASTTSCSYNAVPWCVTDQVLAATSACLCPTCTGGLFQCALATPTDTSSCPTEYGWLCSVTADPGLSSAAHSLPPGFAWITPAPSSTTSEQWYRHTSTLSATKGTSKSDAPFNATLNYWTATYDNGDRVVHPYRAWHCVAGPVCFKPDTDFSRIDFGCWFKKLFLGPLGWKDCISNLVFGIWFRPRIPFPPPIAPVDLNYELQLTTYPGDGSAPIKGPIPAAVPPTQPPPTQPTNSPTISSSPSSSSSSSSESCTEPTATWSVCSTFCSTYTTITSITTEGCSITCTTYSGCSGTDSATATTESACSMTPYWDDPEIFSSLSSLFSSIPFTFPETVELPTTTKGSSLTSATTSPTTVSPSESGSTPAISSTSTTPSTTTTTTSSATTSPTSSKSSSSTSSAYIADAPTRIQGCYDFDDKKNEYEYGEVYCEYQESEAVGGRFDSFIWEDIAGKPDGTDIASAPVGRFCDSLKRRKVVITSDPDTKPWAPKSPAECYMLSNPADAAGHVLLRVGRSDDGCEKKDGKCTDGYCNKDLDFSSYSTEQCRQHFANAIREECYGKGFGKDESEAEVGKRNSFGGSFFTDCMMWTVVAGAPHILPNGTG